MPTQPRFVGHRLIYVTRYLALMKPLFRSLFALIILFSFDSSAQNYIPFPDSNAIWTNTTRTFEWNGQIINPPLLINVDYYCMGTEDTLINSITYHKINECGSDYIGALRDNGGQVFYIPDNSTSELLVYDFTKSVGDTIFNVHFPALGTMYPPDDLIVEQVDSILIGSNYHKKFLFVNMSGEWIEGIGNTQGFLDVPYANLSSLITEIHCMSVSDTTLYPFYGLGSCPMTVGVDEVPVIEQIQVSPNPTTGSCTVSTEGKPFSYELCDISGKVLIISDKETTEALIDLEPFQVGVYLLRVRFGDRIKSVRILKE